MKLKKSYHAEVIKTTSALEKLIYLQTVIVDNHRNMLDFVKIQWQ